MKNEPATPHHITAETSIGDILNITRIAVPDIYYTDEELEVIKTSVATWTKWAAEKFRYSPDRIKRSTTQLSNDLSSPEQLRARVESLSSTSEISSQALRACHIEANRALVKLQEPVSAALRRGIDLLSKAIDLEHDLHSQLASHGLQVVSKSTSLSTARSQLENCLERLGKLQVRGDALSSSPGDILKLLPDTLVQQVADILKESNGHMKLVWANAPRYFADRPDPIGAIDATVG